jgi:tetratricopeptide (TPR) repeat protein
MTTRQKLGIYFAAVLLVPCASLAGWWFYWPHYRLGQAEQAVARGNWTLAEQLLQPLARQETAPLQPQRLLARTLRHLGRPDEAEALLARVSRLGLPEHEFRRELALTRALRGFTPAVERHLEACLKEKADDVEVLQALAEGYTAAKRWEDAERCYTRWLEWEPGRKEVLLGRGRMRLAAGSGHPIGRMANATADFREVLRQDRADFEARLSLAHCLASDARLREAREHLQLCRQQRPDRLEPLTGLAACAVEERDWDEADRLLRQAAKIDGRSPYVLMMQGDLALRREHFEDAITLFRRVLREDARNKAARLKLAQSLRGAGRLAEAEEQMRVYYTLAKDTEAGPPGST